MKKQSNIAPDNIVELRGKAIAKFKKYNDEMVLPKTKEELLRFVQELEIHQIELEIINEELQESRAEVENILEQYTDLYDFAPVGYFTISHDGKILKANLGASSMLGIERSKLLNRRLEQFLSWDSITAFNELLQRAIREKIKVSCEVCYIKVLNNTITSTMSKESSNLNMPCAHIEMLSSENAQEIRIAMIDITERKRNEVELNKYKDHLEEMIEERTLQLTEKDEILECELCEHKKTEAALLISNKELESFSYSVSHDLRAPIRAIDGFTRKLFEGYNSILDDEGKRLLDVVLKNTKNMGMLIDDLLNLSRLGRKKMEPSEINMEELVNEVIIELNDFEEDKKPEITVQHLPAVNGDRALIRHVIFNLLLNSIKFTAHREKPIIEIGYLTKDHQNIYYIKDNGVGFNMKYAHKLFEVFQRLHSLKDFEGTGVGLAIVQRIIHRHGGTVWAEAEVGKGATFYFSLHNNGEIYEDSSI